MATRITTLQKAMKKHLKEVPVGKTIIPKGKRAKKIIEPQWIFPFDSQSCLMFPQQLKQPSWRYPPSHPTNPFNVWSDVDASLCRLDRVIRVQSRWARRIGYSDDKKPSYDSDKNKAGWARFHSMAKPRRVETPHNTLQRPWFHTCPPSRP